MALSFPNGMYNDRQYYDRDFHHNRKQHNFTSNPKLRKLTRCSLLCFQANVAIALQSLYVVCLRVYCDKTTKVVFTFKLHNASPFSVVNLMIKFERDPLNAGVRARVRWLVLNFAVRSALGSSKRHSSSYN